MSAIDDEPLGRVATFSWGIARSPYMAATLRAERVVWRPLSPKGIDAVVGWGRKPNTRAARKWAKRHGIPFISLEDGFLRSVRLGIAGAPPLSVCVDRIGVHYDATQPSAIERALAGEEIPDDQLSHAASVIARIREHGLSKYNHAPDVDLGPRERRRVLVIDQTEGDLAIRLGGCVPGGFATMLEAALDENPHADVIVKIHPDVLHAPQKKHGHLLELAKSARVRLMSEPQNPMHLLGQVDHSYVMTSSMGLEALVAGCSVTCFGMPFYAGWGLTDDRAPVPDRRGRARTLEELVALAYVRYPRYVDPETGEGGDVDTVIEHLALQRACGADHARTRHVCVGFSRWKRAFLPSFLDGPGAQIEFVSRREVDRELNGGDALVVWASREHESLKRLAETRNASLLRMEDGFLRSVGLGSDLFAPASLVVDTRGMYYDPSAPSDLEHILAETAWSDAELTRAAALRRLIIERRISKYNVGARGRIGARANGRAVALAIGQVEDDASIQRGCLDVRTNEALVRAARMASPHAYLIYKPHPDVVSGNRRDGFPLELAERLADEVVVDATLPDCLDVADEVHTMTSLVGFEALLRELRVFVYGQPFYAGWGLTHDRHPHPRRTRRLTLDELVAGTLLRYPRYVHPNSGAYTTPERVVTFLASAPRPPAWTTTWAGRQVRKGQNLLSEVLRAP